jgi:hypothetical protein
MQRRDDDRLIMCTERPGGWQTAQVCHYLSGDDYHWWLSEFVAATGFPVMIASVAQLSDLPGPDTVLNANDPAYRDTIAAITAIISSAPPNSYLTAWHEAFSIDYPSLAARGLLRADSLD